MTHETIDIDAIIGRASELHSLPVVVFEAHRLMADPRVSARQLASLLQRDPAISGRILRLANSAFYGFQKEIRTLSQAIVVLGFQAIKNLTITIGVVDSFRPKTTDGFDYPEFWSHSVATGMAADVIAKACDMDAHDDAYMAGLLHDVGELVIAQHLPASRAAIFRLRDAGAPRRDAEEQVLGWSHPVIGGRLLASWNLPDELVAAVTRHEDGGVGPGPSVADAVHVADAIVSELGLPFDERETDRSRARISETAARNLKIDEARQERWQNAIARDLEAATEFFELVGHGPVRFEE